MHRQPALAAERASRLRTQGFDADAYAALGTRGFAAIRADPPDAIVIDLTQAPSWGRLMGALIREQKSLRSIPLVFVEGDPAKAAKVRAMLPDAAFATWAKADAAIHKAIQRPPAAPMAPRITPKALPGKLGIRAGSKVALLHAPDGFRLPDGEWRRARPEHADVILAFYRSAAGLGREFPDLAASMRKGLRLWIAWPKRTSGTTSDLTMPRIREMAWAYGLTDYKVCAIDETWSGMAVGVRSRAV